MNNKIIKQACQQLIDALPEHPTKAPWHNPWQEQTPTNVKTERQYQGINALILGYAAESPHWVTYYQAQKLGGAIQENIAPHRRLLIWDRKSGSPQLTTQKIYNLAHTKGIDTPHLNETQQTVQDLEGLIQRHGVKIRHHQNNAYYSQLVDYISIPEPSTFPSRHDYYTQLSHQLIHWTGHQQRLNRRSLAFAAPYGTNNTDIETLTANIGASLLCKQFNITNKTHTPTQKWHNVLTKDPQMLYWATQNAQKALDYLRN